MSIFTNTPKAPPPPPPIFNQPATTSTPSVAEPTSPAKTEAEIAAENRKESLLRRSRGRFGTILTGFNGFLNTVDNNDGRKRLLGE